LIRLRSLGPLFVRQTNLAKPGNRPVLVVGICRHRARRPQAHKNMRATQEIGERVTCSATPILGRLAAKDVGSPRNATSCAGVCRRAVHQLPRQAHFAVLSRGGRWCAGWRRSADRTGLWTDCLPTGNFTGKIAVLSLQRRLRSPKSPCNAAAFQAFSLLQISGKIIWETVNFPQPAGTRVEHRGIVSMSDIRWKARMSASSAPRRGSVPAPPSMTSMSLVPSIVSALPVPKCVSTVPSLAITLLAIIGPDRAVVEPDGRELRRRTGLSSDDDAAVNSAGTDQEG
jgi:hypothetical protein